MERVANKIGCFRSQVNPHFISPLALSFCWGAVHGGAYFYSLIQGNKRALVLVFSETNRAGLSLGMCF